MDLDTLQLLTDLKYQKSLAGLSQILAREAQLRGDIRRLRDRVVEAQSLPLAAHSMRNIGADVIWLRWVAKATRELNIELAQVLAQKEALLANQRLALGRKSVAEHLATQNNRRIKAKRNENTLKRSIAIDVMRSLKSQ